MAHGYSIIAYTDHDVMIPHHDLSDEHFLALVGYEMEVDQPRPAGAPYAKTCHMCLIALSPDEAPALLADLKAIGAPAAIVGELTEPADIEILVTAD